MQTTGMQKDSSYHKIHHKHLGKKDGECFGMLVVPFKYFKNKLLIPLYLWLNIGSISIPLLYSFHLDFKLHKRFKWFFLSLILTMGIFIPWDVIFTVNGIWGFNQKNYFLGSKFSIFLLEEWLFFICIPFACVFTLCPFAVYSKNETQS